MKNKDQTSDIGARIEALAKERGMTANELSRRVTGKPDLVRDIKRRGHLPSAENLLRLAQELETTPEYIAGETPDRGPVRSEIALADRHIEWRGPDRGEPGIPLMGTGDCAEVQLCDVSGQMVEVERASFDDDYPVRMLARPPALRGARDLYGIQYVGESMVPRFEPGEVGIVNPHTPTRAGDYVVVQLTHDEGGAVTTVLVKRLVRQSSKELVLEQFNPPLTFIVPRNRVARMHRILQQTDFLF